MQSAFTPSIPLTSRSAWTAPAKSTSAPLSVVTWKQFSSMVLADQADTATAPILPSRKPTKHDIATGRDPERVKFFDITLRDGEQSPGATLISDEKMIIGRQLAKLGVDIIEAGFPIVSDGDFQAVKDIAVKIGNRENPPIICGLAGALEKDITRCYEAVKHAALPRILTFIATSDVHMAHKLK